MEFTQAWATAHGNGTLTQSSIFRLRAQMPSGVAEKVTAVKIEARDASDAAVNIFGSGNELTVMIDEAGDAGEDGILDIYANLPTTAAAIPAGTAFFVRFLTSDRGSVWSYTRYHVFTSALSLTPGKVNALKLNCTVTDKHAGNKTVCDGTTAEKAYLIGDRYQLNSVNGYLVEGTTKYFKLIDNIDMTGYTLTKIINRDSPYKQFDFDGNNKTISNMTQSLFYNIVGGSVKNLTLDHSSVSMRGILTEFIQGTNNTITNVDVSNSTISSTSADFMGGLIGRINSGTGNAIIATISDCDVTNTNVTNTHVDDNGWTFVGGLIGRANWVSVCNCSYSGGTVKGSGMYIGGFIGFTENDASTFTGCKVEDATVDASSITGEAKAGGFIGLLNINCTVKGCTVGTSTTKVIVKAGAYDTTNSKEINTGGFVGINQGTITKDDLNKRSAAYVDVTTTNTDGSKDLNLGGFVGYHKGVISYSDVVVTIKKSDGTNAYGRNIGGFCGKVDYNSNLGGTKIENCTVSGTITGGGYTGGFVGFVSSNANINISNNQVLSGTTVTGNNTPSLGGFAGAFRNGTCSNNKTYANVSGGANYTGGFVGYANPGGSFTKCFAYGTVSSNNTYVGGFVGQAGVAASFVKCRYGGTKVESTYNSSADLCLGGFCGGVPVDASFTGKFEQCWVSQGSSGLEIKSTNNKSRVGGFIGQIGKSDGTGNTGTLHQCRVHKATVTGGQYTGGFVGVSYTSIEECCASGNASTSNRDYYVAANGNSCGGFAGYQRFGSIANCYSHSPVKVTAARSHVGGFIGNCNDANITYSYCTGYVDKPDGVINRGGFIGYIKAASGTPTVTIDYCISAQETAFCAMNYNSNSGKNHRCESGGETPAFTVRKWATDTDYNWSSTYWDLTNNNPTLINTDTAPESL